jgi:tetratricopeptide (TPR) repeat protein
MSPRPAIFISAVSCELRSARQLVANTLTFLGYDSDWQEIFGTEAGDLRAMLRRRIDACKGLVQLVGECYGAEPPTTDNRFGRVSYTQYEALYASSRGKRVWYLFLDASFPTDSHDPEDSEKQVEVQHQVGRELPDQKPEQLENRTYEALGKQLGVDPVALKEQLPRFADELRKSPTATTYERANAAYLARDYNEAERLALAAAHEAQRAIPPKNAEAVRAFELAGWSAEKRIDYADALIRFQDAEKLTDRIRDPLERARVQFGIGMVDYDRGQYSDSERLFREVLKERERVLRAEDADTLVARSDLETALFYQGKYAEVEEQLRILLTLKERALGLEHPETLKARNNLGGLLYEEGKYAEAETEFRAVLKLKEKVLGPEHRDTLGTRNNLAGTLAAQGKYAEAELQMRAVVKLDEKAFGPEHPNTLAARSNLAELLDREGKSAEAETEEREVLELDEKVLGPEHPDTLNTRNNLAASLLHQGKHIEAETEARQVVRLEEKVRGAEHPATLETLQPGECDRGARQVFCGGNRISKRLNAQRKSTWRRTSRHLGDLL